MEDSVTYFCSVLAVFPERLDAIWSIDRSDSDFFNRLDHSTKIVVYLTWDSCRMLQLHHHARGSEPWTTGLSWSRSPSRTWTAPKPSMPRRLGSMWTTTSTPARTRGSATRCASFS